MQDESEPSSVRTPPEPPTPPPASPPSPALADVAKLGGQAATKGLRQLTAEARGMSSDLRDGRLSLRQQLGMLGGVLLLISAFLPVYGAQFIVSVSTNYFGVGFDKGLLLVLCALGIIFLSYRQRWPIAGVVLIFVALFALWVHFSAVIGGLGWFQPLWGLGVLMAGLGLGTYSVFRQKWPSKS